MEKAKQTLKEPTDVSLDEYVPDRFLCSGGTSGYQDAITCKGLDSDVMLASLCDQHDIDILSVLL